MTKLVTNFNDFISAINLTNEQQNHCIEGHQELRTLLKEDNKVNEIMINSFIQGSYIRNTITKPKEDKNPDVDIVVVTKLSEEQYTPKKAFEYFEPFLNKNYRFFIIHL